MLILAIWRKKYPGLKRGFTPDGWPDFSTSSAFENNSAANLWKCYQCDELTPEVAETFTSNVLYYHSSESFLWLTDVAVVSVGVEIGRPETNWVSDEGWSQECPPSAFFNDLEFTIASIRCSHKNIPVAFVTGY